MAPTKTPATPAVADPALQAQLREGLAALALELSAAQQQQLLGYVDLLGRWNQVFSLTAIRQRADMLQQHVLDSLAIVAPLRATLSGIAQPQIIDVGSGGGTPGLILAITQPDWALWLLDSNQKKTTFLRQAVIDLGLNNVQVVCSRVEAWQHPGADLVISRAFADLGDFARWSGHLLAPQAWLVTMKGVYPEQELQQLPAHWPAPEVLSLHVPGLHAERHLVRVRAPHAATPAQG